MSRRSLRPDPNFDALLSKIFPDREEYEEQQEKVSVGCDPSVSSLH